MTVKDRQITDKLDELGISDRIAMPVSSFELCIHLRFRGIDAHLTQQGQVTVPGQSYRDSCQLLHAWERQPTDWRAEARQLIGRTA